MNTTGFTKGNLLVPRTENMTAWSVIACDQYTSQPQYWSEVEKFVRSKPSTLNMVIPECYLSTEDLDQRVGSVNRAMRTYLRRRVFEEYNDYIYVCRTLSNGRQRHGIMGVVDLELYDSHTSTHCPIRASEGAIQGRVSPRLQIREIAPLEVSHAMMLIDDRDRQVIEPLAEQTSRMKLLYDFELMMDGGRIQGYLVTPEQSKSIDQGLQALADPQRFAQKYGITDKGMLLYAIGDGNQSLVTAKEYYERLKRSLSREKAVNHPARYAMVEVVNLNDDCLEFEPINRLVFGVDTSNFLHQMDREFGLSDTPLDGQYFDCFAEGREQRYWVRRPSSNLVTGTVQNFIDYYIQNFSGKVDYVHGTTVVRQLSAQRDNIGMIFPSLPKDQLFRSVLLDGALPRKTFSMGHADDKRFYLECRKIR